MCDFAERTKLLIGKDAVEALKNKSVLLFGVGGVGSYCAEALARAGIGKITIVDGDTVSLSNINRQLVALHSTVGKNKCDVMKQRMLDVNPMAEIFAVNEFFTANNADSFDFSKYDYVADAIDMVTSKILIAQMASEAGVPSICAMGAGNRLNPGGFVVADIYETKNCPLARVMRRELRKRNVAKLKTVFSQEETYKVFNDTEKTIGSISFVPGAEGLIMAGEIIKDLIHLYLK